MKYIDSSIPDTEQTVAAWMLQFSSGAPCHFRCQAGYFTFEGAGALLPALGEWAAQGLLVRLLLGSNRAATLASHVSFLAGRLGIPRAHVDLGIVSFDGALFHPKVYHFLREDGSEAAYVGSANLTGPGISGLNVEAGVIVDTSQGDDPDLLRCIRERIDSWFDKGGEGLSRIGSPEDIQKLLDDGYLSLRAQQSAPPEAGQPAKQQDVQNGPPRPRRAAPIRLPRLNESEAAVADDGGAPLVSEPTLALLRDQEGSNGRFKYTEASFHYPQGTHLGHILAILWHFSAGRQGTPFDDEFVRLNGSLGTGRIAAFRRQIKYKLLAAMELGLISDIRYVDDAANFEPELTAAGNNLWQLISPFINTHDLEMGGAGEQSTTLPRPPAHYNRVILEACASSDDLREAYSAVMLGMPALRQMAEFLAQFPADRVAKSSIYRGFFDFPLVVEFCNEVGIEPQTEESAKHRCPFLLNILESLGRIDQERAHVIRR